MDQYFDFFLKEFGPVLDKNPVPESAFKKYQGVLPDQLLTYWRAVGWGGFARGLFWLVNPEEWDEPMEAMLDETGFLERDAYHVIARNAFGDLWLWGQKTGGSLSIRCADGKIFPSGPRNGFAEKGIDVEVQFYFASQEVGYFDLLDDQQKPLFDRALKKLGQLEPHEVYGFVPLPALGGACDLKYLQKVEAATYMDMLAQSTPMRVMPDYAAIADGRA